jgi:hypothetical protein
LTLTPSCTCSQHSHGNNRGLSEYYICCCLYRAAEWVSSRLLTPSIDADIYFLLIILYLEEEGWRVTSPLWFLLEIIDGACNDRLLKQKQIMHWPNR